MSSTRRSSTGEFNQERFCSSPEFVGDAINGLASAKRIAIVKDEAVRKVLWFIQWRSLTSGGLRKLCDELRAMFPENIKCISPTLYKLSQVKNRTLTKYESASIRQECYHLNPCSETWYFGSNDDRDWDSSPTYCSISEVVDVITKEFDKLPDALVRFCLDPQEEIKNGVWYFADLLGSLTALRERSIAAARARLADTAVTREINETLDFWYARRRMVLIEGVAGIGRTETAKAFRDAHAGMVRYVELPSSSDDRSFFATIAKSLGIARGASFKGQQMKVRIEEMLSTSELMVVFDEAQYLWTQAMRPRRTPDRLLWVKTTFDNGTPIALVAHTDFSIWQKHYVERTLWTDEQFERRVNRRILLALSHTNEDMLKIARAHFPSGDLASHKMLAGYAVGTEKKQASGIKEALESATHRANLDGRDKPTFEDIKHVLTHVHKFLSEDPPGNSVETPCNEIAAPLQPLRTGHKRQSISRISTPANRIAEERTSSLVPN